MRLVTNTKEGPIGYYYAAFHHLVDRSACQHSHSTRQRLGNLSGAVVGHRSSPRFVSYSSQYLVHTVRVFQVHVHKLSLSLSLSVSLSLHPPLSEAFSQFSYFFRLCLSSMAKSVLKKSSFGSWSRPVADTLHTIAFGNRVNRYDLNMFHIFQAASVLLNVPCETAVLYTTDSTRHDRKAIWVPCQGGLHAEWYMPSQSVVHKAIIETISHEND